MIITSSQQIDNIINPGGNFDSIEFENITLKFGSFVCISKGKKLNFLNFLKFLVEDKKTQKIFFELLGDYNLQNIIRTYLSLTPNIYKKVFRFKQRKSLNSESSENSSDRTTNIQLLSSPSTQRTSMETAEEF
jgi:hypothetical protein